MDSAAIFSPTVARQAASTARDWNYIDSWLSSRFRACCRGPSAPVFERNADTLKALLALAALNESADEDRELLVRAEADCLREVKEREEAARIRTAEGEGTSLARLQERVLTELEAALPKEGQTALTALATSALELGIAQPTPQQIAEKMISLQATVFELEQSIARVETLQRYISKESEVVQDLLLKETDLRGSVDSMTDAASSQTQPSAGRATAIPLPHPSLAKDNIDATRRIKTLTQTLPDLQKQLTALSTSVGMPDPTIEDVQRMEESCLALVEERKELDGQLGRFEGLPSDVAEARLEVERRKAELRRLVAQRDEVFEGLVERETPRRPGRR